MTETERPRARLPWWWLLLMLAVVVWNVWAFWPGGQQPVSLPYTAFLDQVRAGNVSTVQISGDQISGQLAAAITWPQPTPGATPTGQATGTAAPQPTTYTAFRTTFPEAVGDTALLPLLESHGVEVSVESPPSPWFTMLLTEMDGFDEWHEVIVLAATNRSDVLDPALLRPGRFDREVVVGLPDRLGREGILKIHTRQLRLAGDVDLSLLAHTTTGFSGADLSNLSNEAALAAARHDRTQVTMADFDEALDKVLLGGVRALLLDAHERRTVAYHEAGHAVVAWLTPAADPVHKVTIIPHREALGVTQQLPGEDHYNYTRQYLLARLQVMLGGRAAEELAMGEITTGAESDLVQATRLARRMVTRWGMGSLGLAAFQADDEQPFLGYELAQGRDYSEDTAARIDQDVQRLLDECHGTVTELLTGAREPLDRLVEVLLKEETIDQQGMGRIVGPRPVPVSAEQAEAAPMPPTPEAEAAPMPPATGQIEIIPERLESREEV